MCQQLARSDFGKPEISEPETVSAESFVFVFC